MIEQRTTQYNVYAFIICEINQGHMFKMILLSVTSTSKVENQFDCIYAVFKIL